MEEEEQGDSSSSTCVTEESVSEEMEHTLGSTWRHCLNSSQKLATHTDSDVFYVKRKRRRGNVRRTWIPLQISKTRAYASVACRPVRWICRGIPQAKEGQHRYISGQSAKKQRLEQTTTHCQIFPKRSFCHTSDSQQSIECLTIYSKTL